MTVQFFLMTMLAVWCATLVIFVLKVLLQTLVRIAEDRHERKIEERRTEQKRKNETGRIIGFRPIETEGRA